MPRAASDKRDRLAAASAELVATRGLDGATIAAIADLAGVPHGSVYYYLRSKEQVAEAAVAYVSELRTAQLRHWSASSDPQARLTAYLNAAAESATTTSARGNAATLAAQLRIAAPEAADAAAQVIRETVDWAAAQFEELGHSAQAAQARALHLVTGVEGAGQLAHALGDPTPVERETTHLSRWVANSRSSS